MDLKTSSLLSTRSIVASPSICKNLHETSPIKYMVIVTWALGQHPRNWLECHRMYRPNGRQPHFCHQIQTVKTFFHLEKCWCRRQYHSWWNTKLSISHSIRSFTAGLFYDLSNRKLPPQVVHDSGPHAQLHHVHCMAILSHTADSATVTQHQEARYFGTFMVLITHTLRCMTHTGYWLGRWNKSCLLYEKIRMCQQKFRHWWLTIYICESSSIFLVPIIQQRVLVCIRRSI